MKIEIIHQTIGEAKGGRWVKKWHFGYVPLHIKHTGVPLLTLFFETLEKQPCKQKTVVFRKLF